MKYLQTIAGLRAKSGGTSTCTYDLIKAMRGLSCNVDLMTLQADDLLGNNEWWIKALPNDSISSYGCFIRKHWPGLRGRKNYFSQWGELLKI